MPPADTPDYESEPTFSAFWPMLILALAFLLLMGWQDYQLNRQRSGLLAERKQAAPAVTEAQNLTGRYVALMRDLVVTSKTDPAARQIVDAAAKAGLIHNNPNAAPPTSSDQAK